jgi:hypothetical protein
LWVLSPGAWFFGSCFAPEAVLLLADRLIHPRRAFRAHGDLSGLLDGTLRFGWSRDGGTDEMPDAPPDLGREGLLGGS